LPTTLTTVREKEKSVIFCYSHVFIKKKELE